LRLESADLRGHPIDLIVEGALIVENALDK
jgi:hypothetical protein